jgi:hypothetical protein
MVFRGWWQSDKYFSNVFDDISRMFKFKGLSAIPDSLVSSLDGNSVSVHVRGGDYVGSSMHGIVRSSYYSKAMALVRSKIENPLFVVFTDDIAYAKSMLQFLPTDSFVFADSMIGGNPGDSLFVMSCCKHAIISNSTFSWWGARLMKPGGMVIAPSKWINFHGQYESSRDMLLDGWISMDNDNRLLDLEAVPAIAIGARESSEGGWSRYSGRGRFSGQIHSCSRFVPPQPGGNTVGCSRAHVLAAKMAIDEFPGSPVLLLEDDAVRTGRYRRHLSGIPADCDILWVGYSNHRTDPQNPPSPHVEPSATEYRKINGICQGTHSVVLVTERGKSVWLDLCQKAADGKLHQSTDIAVSSAGCSLCNQYILRCQHFMQPDYPATGTPIPK